MTPIDQHLAVQQACKSFQKSLESEAPDYLVARIIEYIHNNLFDEGLNVNAVLDECSIASNTIHARFRCAMTRMGYRHMTMRAYIEYLRIEAARSMMENKEIDLTTIAIFLGFGQYERFNRACHRRLGCSPSLYREQVINGLAA